MIKHIVMWTIKKDAGGISKDENLRKVKSMLEGLRRTVPGIQSLEVGVNFNPGSTAYDLVLYTEFLTRVDLDAYQKHPDHLTVGDFIGKVRDLRAVIDYEV